jgi:hypothetical protein
MSRLLWIVLLIVGLPWALFAQDSIEAIDSSAANISVRFMYYPNTPTPNPDSLRYVLEASPDLWYNAYDGLKFGIHLRGGKSATHHVFNVFAWGNSGVGQYGLPEGTNTRGFMPVSFMADYRTSLSKLWRNFAIALSGRALDGLFGYQIGVEKQNAKRTITYGFYFKSMIRSATNGIPYLLDRQNWDAGQWNNSFNLTFDHRYAYTNGTGAVNVFLRSSALGSQTNYHYLRATAANHTDMWLLTLHSRVFLQLGYGTNWGAESSLFVDKASPEEMMDNKFTRAAGIFPASWGTYGLVTNHFHQGGGLNLRGYAGYLSPEQLGDQQLLAYSGSNGASISAELDFDRLLGSDKWPARKYLRLNTYLFGDVGILSVNADGTAPQFAMPRADAGLGIALTIKQWGPLEKLKPLTIRFDMPLYLSRPTALQPEPWQWRWVLGIGRTF